MLNNQNILAMKLYLKYIILKNLYFINIYKFNLKINKFE